MKKYMFYVSTGYVGSKIQEEMEFDDNVTDKEIEEVYIDWLSSNTDQGWYEIEVQND